ncbi:MAG: hypothetical protein HONBIEJF_02714 [Fimbriimonadaceae bacterium]|nr:hypothetical protein [Fimbriimonadaceae bacterium]
MPLDSGVGSRSVRQLTTILLFGPWLIISWRLLEAGRFTLGFAALCAGLLIAVLSVGGNLLGIGCAAWYASVFALSWQAPGPRPLNPIDHGALILGTVGSYVLVQWCYRQGRSTVVIAALLLALGLIISRLSGEAGSPGWMVEFFRDTMGMSEGSALIATVVVRKAVHFAFYGIMALLAAAIGSRLTFDIRRTMAFATFWTLAHAAFDELRQNQTPNRTGTFVDVVLDLMGVAFALLLWYRHQNRATSR